MQASYSGEGRDEWTKDMVGPSLETLKPHWKIMVGMVVRFSPALFSFTGTGTEHVESWIFIKKSSGCYN